jgi:hypothetical protein
MCLTNTQVQKKAVVKDESKAKAAPKKVNLLDLKRTTNIGIKMSKLKVCLRAERLSHCGGEGVG